MPTAGLVGARRQAYFTLCAAYPQQGKLNSGHNMFHFPCICTVAASSRLIIWIRSKIVELHANRVPCPTAQLLTSNSDAAFGAVPALSCDVDAAFGAVPALSCDVDEYDPDVEYDHDVDFVPAVQSSCLPSSSPPSQLPPLPRVHAVDSAVAVAAAMAALEEHDVFAVDLEGVELGRGGTIAILQVYPC
jgi:hypothetical protein